MKNKAIKALLMTCLVLIGVTPFGLITTVEADSTSLQALVDSTPDGGTLVLTEDVVLDKAVTINKEITITSVDGVKLTAASTRHFSLTTATAYLTLSNITLSGNDTGGGIAGYGTIVLEDGAIVTHNYNTKNGGGISSNGNVILKSGSEVSYNTCSTDTYSYGGGIYILGNTTTLIVEQDAVIKGNYASQQGGGIYAINTTISFSGTLEGNSAKYSGGGMYYSQGVNGNITIDGARIIDNTAYAYGSTSSSTGSRASVRGGAGIYILISNNNDVSIRNTIFSGNEVMTHGVPEINGGTSYYTTIYPYGGGLMVDGSSSTLATLAIADSTFDGNIAGAGGGMYSKIETEITDSTFTNNKAIIEENGNSTASTRGDYGGAIAFNGSHSLTLTIRGSTIAKNYAFRGAGIGYTNMYLHLIFIDSSSFYDNEIGGYPYIWDLNNPRFNQTSVSSIPSTIEAYKANMTNIISVTEPYNNLYNNVDIMNSQYSMVVFDTNGGSFSEDVTDFFNELYAYTSGKTNTFDADDELYTYDNLGIYVLNGTIVPNWLAATKEGYTFMGWLDESGNEIGEQKIVTEHVVYTAQWRSETTVVTFEKDTVDLVDNWPEDTIIAIDTQYTLPVAPTRSGYRLTGWAITGDDTLYQPGDTVYMDMETVTITAIWMKEDVGPVNPDGPVDPVNPVNPVNPVDPVVPVEPVGPVDNPTVPSNNQGEVTDEEKAVVDVDTEAVIVDDESSKKATLVNAGVLPRYGFYYGVGILGIGLVLLVTRSLVKRRYHKRNGQD